MSRTRSRAGCAAVALVASFALAVPDAHAQQPSPPDAAPAPPPDASSEAASLNARARYNAGTKAFSEKRFVEAALDFEAAAAEKASPVALYTAALSWEQANVPERAADDYARALAVPGLPADKVGLARDRLAVLEGLLGAVSVVGPPGWRVQLDADTEVPLPAVLHGTAGVHTLSARAPSRPIQRRPVVLERGKTSKLDLATEPPPPSPEEAKKETPPPPPPPPPAPPPAGPDWKRPAGFVALGVGGALLLSGVVLGSEAIGARDVYRGAPTQDGLDHASELQTWTNVAFIAGGVVAAGGVALVLWPSAHAGGAPTAKTDGFASSQESGPEHRGALSVVPTPGGMLLRGAF
jgi:hypothetical protein